MVSIICCSLFLESTAYVLTTREDTENARRNFKPGKMLILNDEAFCNADSDWLQYSHVDSQYCLEPVWIAGGNRYKRHQGCALRP